jgi:hypothetical protein
MIADEIKIQIIDEDEMNTVNKPVYGAGVGLDIGTMYVVSARQTPDGVATKLVRDTFLDLEPSAKRSLKMSKVDYVEKEGSLVVIGDSALTMANLFKREARRPLSRGIISAGEIDAQEILSLLTYQVLEDPIVEGEHCFFSVPASPIDEPSQDIIYHTEVFRKIIGEHGYTAHPTNEAMAIIFSQCAEENFSGLSVSFGAGMCNIALAYQANEAMVFSVARGGDWIDACSAKAVGKTASQMCSIKEKGIDLGNPDGREQEAIVFYVKALINYCLENIEAQFKLRDVELPESIPFIVSGGTSMAQGFLNTFQSEFDKVKEFPISISEVRSADEPLKAVAKGLLVLAIEEHED